MMRPHQISTIFTCFFWCWLLVLDFYGSGVHSFSPVLLPSHLYPLGRDTQPSRTVCQSYSDTNMAIAVAEKVQPWVVLVTPIGVRNMTNRGSGFILAPGEIDDLLLGSTGDDTGDSKGTYVITAAHVAAPGYSIEVTLPRNTGNESVASTTYPATVVARNTTLDLALLRMHGSIGVMAEKSEKNEDDGEAITGMKLCRDTPPVGTLTFAHGHPASRLRSAAMTSGIVCGIADGLGVPDTLNRNRNSRSSDQLESPEEETRESNITPTNSMNAVNQDSTVFVVTDSAMSQGMSGGPLVDSAGTVIGVNALIRPDLRALGNYAVSSLEVLTFLNSIPRVDDLGSTLQANGKYKVWLYNDPMNKKARVSAILNAVASLDDGKANEVMMQAHTVGRGMVGNYTDRSTAESVYQSLRNQDLLVEIE